MSDSTAPYGQEPPAWWPIVRINNSNSYRNWGCAFCDNPDSYGGVIGTVETGWMQGRDVCPDCIPTDIVGSLEPIEATLEDVAVWIQKVSLQAAEHFEAHQRLIRYAQQFSELFDEPQFFDLVIYDG